MTKYDRQRQAKTPPHVSLRNLRKASGMTLDQVCAEVSRILGLPDEKLMPRGTLSAIESGTRGASRPMLDALALAYGLDPGDLVTDFVPRNRELADAS